MSRRALPDISQFAIVGTVVWVTGSKHAYILAFDAEYCLIRTRHRNGNWSKPYWIEARDGPIIGGLPAAAQAPFIEEARGLQEEIPPPRPPSKYNRGEMTTTYSQRDARQGELFL